MPLYTTPKVPIPILAIRETDPNHKCTATSKTHTTHMMRNVIYPCPVRRHTSSTLVVRVMHFHQNVLGFRLIDWGGEGRTNSFLTIHEVRKITKII